MATFPSTPAAHSRPWTHAPYLKAAAEKRVAVTCTYITKNGAIVRDDGLPRTVDATVDALRMIASSPGFTGEFRQVLGPLFCDLVKHGHALAYMYQREKDFNAKVDEIIEEFLA